MGLFKGCNLTQLFYSSNYFDIEALVLVVDSASESPREVFSFWNFGQKAENFACLSAMVEHSCTHIHSLAKNVLF